MARIGFIPNKTSMEVREPDGDTGQIPAATETAAGIMTARHVQMLEEVYAAMRSQCGSAPMIIERPWPDTSQFLTKLEARQLLQQIPRAMDMAPEVMALRSQVAELYDQISGTSRQLLAAPDTSAATVDATARQVLEGVISGMDGIEQRLRSVEQVITVLRHVADAKAERVA